MFVVTEGGSSEVVAYYGWCVAQLSPSAAPAQVLPMAMARYIALTLPSTARTVPERPPPEYERDAVSAAEGMIACLREAGGESGEASGTPATAEPKDDRRDGA